MLIWVEEQPSGIIALIVFGFSYGMAIVVFAATAILSRRRISQDLRAITPSILSPLGTMAGLLIAFLAVRVWANLDHAVAAMADEASSIREAVLLADLLPTDKRAVIRDGVETYLHFVDARDWPAMTSGTASLREVPPGLTDAMSAVLSFAPTTPGLDLAQQRAVIALEHALEARRQRILLSEAAIAPIQWLVCLTVQALILITVALIHIERRAAGGVAMTILSTAFATAIVLLMVYDRPFDSGGIVLQPVALHQIDLSKR